MVDLSGSFTKSHTAPVTFDGLLESLPHVPILGFKLDPPDDPASDLLVTELYDRCCDAVVLWIEGRELMHRCSTTRASCRTM